MWKAKVDKDNKKKRENKINPVHWQLQMPRHDAAALAFGCMEAQAQ